jgi:hypothetical protein
MSTAMPQTGTTIINSTSTTAIDHLTASDDDIALFCDTPDGNFIGGNHRVVKISNEAVVKFGISVNIEEANNQRRAYSLLNPHIVCVPRVYRFFQREKYVQPEIFNGRQLHNGYFLSVGYLVMEHVEGNIVPASQYPELASDLSTILKQLHNHQSDLPGPADGGVSRGTFWEDDFPAFKSKAMLDNWINTRLPSDHVQVSFASSKFVFSHLDLTPRNLLRLRNGSVCLLDWASAGYYPRVFEFAMLQLRPLDDLEDIFNRALIQGFTLSHEETAQLELVKQAWRNSQRYALYVKLLYLYSAIANFRLTEVQ